MQVSFKGSQLFYNETDGSSFPNGGLRQTHTAAAFNTWDKSSPAFVYQDTLWLPSAFIAWTGHALDHKTPLLRSEVAINREGKRLIKHFGFSDVGQVVSNVGWEAEFFVVDRELYLKRPDLVMAGRTVMGSLPARNQQTDYNYFGQMNLRCKAMLSESVNECLKLGIAMNVLHNEVAPSQHEFSPIFTLTNIANDHNQICMQITNDVAAKHGLTVLWHEKPFLGINGSGKHNNWGLNTDTGMNLYTPGKSDESEAVFVAFTAALLYAVHKHGELFRCSVATAGNDHRLGAQEAPPAIISLYPGLGVEAQFKAIVEGGELYGYKGPTKDISYGSNVTQTVSGNAEDRNRTAPLPFCGNRYEFRAVGSTQNIALPNTILNTCVADGCALISNKIESGMSARDAVAEVIKGSMPAIFCGNGYGEEWPIEAEKRGLLNLKTTPDALAHWATEKNKDLFEKYAIFAREETEARAEIMYEAYLGQVDIEATVMLQMMDTMVIPACAEDLKCYEAPGGSELIGDRKNLYATMAEATEKLRKCKDATPDDVIEACSHYRDVVLPAMAELREFADAAENKCSKKLWPMPNYTELLFHHHSDAC